MITITQADKNFVHSVRYRDAMVRAWAKRTGRMSRSGAFSYSPTDVPKYIDVPDNAARSRAEVIQFTAGAHSTPYVAYLKEDSNTGPSGERWRSWRLTTFMGDTLAHVLSRNTWRTGRGSFWARGIDGRLYHGRHNGTGMYCRMRLAKDQS